MSNNHFLRSVCSGAATGLYVTPFFLPNACADAVAGTGPSGDLIEAVMSQPDAEKALRELVCSENELWIRHRHRDPVDCVFLYANANPAVRESVASDATGRVAPAHQRGATK